MVHSTAGNLTQIVNSTGALQITSNGGFAVTGAATFSSTISSGALTVTGGASFTDDVVINNGSPELYFGTTGNHYNWRIAAQEIVDTGFEIAVGSQDTDYSNDTYTAKFVVKANGNVGIGLTDPGHQLDVEGSANQYAIARFGSSVTDNEELTIGYWNASAGNGIPALAAGSSFGGLIQGGENGKLILGIRDNDATDSVQIISGGGNFMSDSTYDTVVANFQADGKVGIGTSQPIALTGNASPSLTISSNGPYILLQDANNANKVRYISNNTGEFQFGIVNDDGSTSKTEHMRIDSSGNVSVTTSGVALNAPVLQVTNADVATYTGTTPAIHSPASATMAFSMGGAEQMRIDSNGVTIGGSAAPNNYSGYNTLTVQTGTTGSIFQLDGATSNHACMLVNNNGQLLVRSDQNNVASNSGILFQVDGSNRMFIDDNTLVRVNGPTRQAGGSSSGTKMYTGLCTGSFYSNTGYVVIETNIPGHNSSGNANMFSISIKGYGYANTTEGIIDVNIGCYSGENNFYNRGYSGSNIPKQWVKEGIQFATNTSTGKLAIFCGGATSPVKCELAVTDFIQGYVNVNEDYATGWSMSIKTSTSGYNNFQPAVPRETAYPRFEAYTTSSFTITGGAWRKVSSSLSETTDEMGTYANGRFTPGVRGMYLINCGGYSTHSTQNQNDRMAWSFYKNGSLTFISGGNYSHGDSPLPNMSQILYLDENDYVELWAFSSVTCTWANSTHAVWWHGMRIGSQT